MSSSPLTTRYYSRRYTKEEIARMSHCSCKFPIYKQVAWTPENPGRRFKGCPTRNKDKKCDVYGFLDDELPSQYYKDLVYKLYKDNQFLECKVDTLTHQDDADNQVANNSSCQLPMEAIYKDLNELKVKGKLYDILFVGSTSLIIVMVILLAYVIVVSVSK